MVSVYISIKLPNELLEQEEKEKGEGQLDYVIAGTIRGTTIEGMALLTAPGSSFLDSAAGLYHFDGYRMAPAQNDAFEFFMAETTSSNTQNEAEDSNLDPLLQEIRDPGNPASQTGLSDVCEVSEGADGTFDFMCDQSSAQYTLEEVANDSVVNSTTDGLVQSPTQSSTGVSRSSPLSNSSLAATAGTCCDSWLNVADYDTDAQSSLQKENKEKVSPDSSPKSRPPLPGYQSMTPWTDDLISNSPYPSPSHEMPCFYLNPQVLQDQGSDSQSSQRLSPPLPSTLNVVSTAVTETVDSVPAWRSSLAGHAHGQSGGHSVFKKSNRTSSSLQHNREKRFKKTAEALQKCGLWSIAMKTGNLIKRNADLQKELEALREEATLFLKSVIQNPENQELFRVVSPAVCESPPIQRMSPRDGCESETAAAVATITTTSSKISESGCSSTSGYVSCYEDCIVRTRIK